MPNRGSTLSRRAFFPAAALGLPRRSSAAPTARIESIVTISRQPEFYHGWPTLTRRKNGDLLVTYSGGRQAHVCPFGRVEMIRSTDEGHTWSWPETLWDSPIDDRDSGVLETPAGSLLVTTFTSLAFEAIPNPPENWQAVLRRASPDQRKSLLDNWMLRSADGGMTWSAPFRVPVNSPHGPVVFSEGRLLYAGKRLWSPGKEVGVCESTDDGRSWRWLSSIPVRPGDRVEEYHELHAVRAADGRVLVHIRNHNPSNERETLQCESSDGGVTWSMPHSIGVWGLPSHLLLLHDGRLLMSYGYRRVPYGNQARISEDGGRTWSNPVTISSDGASGDLGYPSTVELAGGQLLTVWYEKPKESPKAILRLARWSLV